MPFSFRPMLFLLLISLVACSSPAPATPVAPTATAIPPTASPQPGPQIEEAVFTHALAENMTPTDVAEAYTPEQDVYLSIKLAGNPKEGVVGARFFYRDQPIAETEVDLAQARDENGVIFSLGGNTYVGITLSHEQPFPPSRRYQARISVDGTPAGDYDFQVIPPADALPSHLLSATLAEDVVAKSYEPYHPTDAFPADKAVFLAGRVDLGRFSTLSARWYIDGKLDDNATRIITASEDITDTPFYFTYLPQNNWPTGEQKVVLAINDEPVGEYVFTIHPPAQ